MNRFRAIALFAVLLTGVVSAVALHGPAESAPEPSAAADPYAVVHGMTVSCHRAGQVWGTDATADAFAELKSLGCNWVAIHPYADIREDGTVNARMQRLYDHPDWLTRPIEEAHRCGLKILIKPHLAYWGTTFDWRGEITFDTDAQWKRFFRTYEQWITRVAEITSNADAFAVGTELEGTTQHEAPWRRIISAVRARTDAPLTYCANWDRYERVPFWDAVDVIGIQAYFPLVDHTDAPTAEELRRGWASVHEQLQRLSHRYNRKILFSELGYNRSAWAAQQPWNHRQGGPDAELVQRRCLEAALETIDGSDVICGAFLWKWFPGRPGRGNFLASTPSMRAVIAEFWQDPTDHADSGRR